MPVVGTHNAAMAATWGSISLARAAVIFSIGSSFSRPRWYRLSSSGSSLGWVATTILPQTSCAMPFCSQNSTIERAPALAITAFRLPGL